MALRWCTTTRRPLLSPPLLHGCPRRRRLANHGLDVYPPASALVPYEPPAWAAHLPNPPSARLQLAMRPTPIQSWALPDVAPEQQLFIKRDDMTGSTLSGNKVRKLEFILAKALQEGYDSVITCGAVQSNHCRATAVAAREVGLQTHLFLRSDTQDVSALPSAGNFLLDNMVGAGVHIVPRIPFATGLLPLMKTLEASLAAKGQRALLIPVGGSDTVGLWGYLEAFQELLDQGLRDRIDDIFLGVGSGGSACGLSIANWLCGSPVRIHAVSVCDDQRYFHDHVDETLAELGLAGATKSRDILTVIDGYKGRGYGRTSPQELQFANRVAAASGIILDPVYTAKAALGLRGHLLDPSRHLADRRVLFLHTGGLAGLLGHDLGDHADLFRPHIAA